MFTASWWRFSSVQALGFCASSCSCFIALSTMSSVTLSPDNCFVSAFTVLCFSCCIVLANLSHPFLIMLSIHMSSSISRNLMSNAGS